MVIFYEYVNTVKPVFKGHCNDRTPSDHTHVLTSPCNLR